MREPAASAGLTPADSQSATPAPAASSDPQIEAPDTTGACDLLVAIGPVAADADRSVTLASGGDLTAARTLLGDVAERAKGVMDDFADREAAAPTGRPGRFFGILAMLLGTIEDTATALAEPGSALTSDRLNELSMAVGSFGSTQGWALGIGGQPALCPGLAIASPLPALTKPPVPAHATPPGARADWEKTVLAIVKLTKAPDVATSPEIPHYPYNFGIHGLGLGGALTRTGNAPAFAGPGPLFHWNGDAWQFVSCAEGAPGTGVADLCGTTNAMFILPVPSDAAEPGNFFGTNAPSDAPAGFWAYVIPIFRSDSNMRPVPAPIEGVVLFVEVGR